MFTLIDGIVIYCYPPNFLPSLLYWTSLKVTTCLTSITHPPINTELQPDTLYVVLESICQRYVSRSRKSQ